VCCVGAVLLQIEGGFVQGMGWLCLEEMIWGDKVCLVGGSGYRVCWPAFVLC
jgi:xanthine dehydrogenase molybdopterin-binding subunit B